MMIGAATAAEPLRDDKAVVASLGRKAVEAWSNNHPDEWMHYLSPSIVITDSTPPYFFRAPTAASDWLKAFAADSKAHDITDPWQTMGEPMEVEVDGPHAYVAYPAVYGFKQHGKPVQMKATVTMELEKSEKDWSIVSWTWSKR
jgi:hypothetical protein